MTKHIVFFLCSILILLLLLGTIFVLKKQNDNENNNNQSNKEKAMLYINNKPIINQHIKISNDSEEIPLLPILAEFGYAAEWSNDDTAIIAKGKTALYLRLSDGPSLVTKSGEELFLPAPGSKNEVCFAVERDVVVDRSMLWYILNQLGIKAQITITRELGNSHIEIITES